MISKAREEYEALYQEEKELNQKFNQFVCNYKAIFEGRNTRRDQIGGTEKRKNMSLRKCPSNYLLSAHF